MFFPWQHNGNTCRSHIHGHLSVQLIFWQILAVHPCLRVHMSWCAGPLRVQEVCSQHGNRHSTHNQQIREDNRSGCSWGVPSILARLTVSWCLVNLSRVWSDGWLCQLPNRTIAHGQPRGGRARSSAPAQTCANVRTQRLRRRSRAPASRPVGNPARLPSVFQPRSNQQWRRRVGDNLLMTMLTVTVDYP